MRDYEVRHPDVAVTLLRFGNVLGDVLDSPFARLFDRAVIPTVFGFDPRLQFLDEDDAVSALAHATLNECRGHTTSQARAWSCSARRSRSSARSTRR